MPELPEVETVRRGVAAWITDRRISDVEVLHTRSVRRHLPGPTDFADRLRGATVTGSRRRGKYLWFPLDTGDSLVGHLGMSGQLLLQPATTADGPHLRVRFRFADDQPELRFVDQRTFGEFIVSDSGDEPPAEVAHIAPDVYDPAFDLDRFIARLRGRRSTVKRALLDQSLISGIGNIYADEALWRVGLHGEHPTEALDDQQVTALVDHVTAVFDEALRQGGTSFDSLYVDVNGDAGYFARELAVYGRQGEPCPRCGSLIVRESFMNRSSHFCPRCQRRP